jgi:hypothetical protein
VSDACSTVRYCLLLNTSVLAGFHAAMLTWAFYLRCM